MGHINRETQKYYYNLQLSKGECSCGPGSQLDLVRKAGTIGFIEHVVRKYDIKSVTDCACGLFENWMFAVNLNGAMYTGLDINDEAVSRNKEKYPHLKFCEFDLNSDQPVRSDLLVCRDCFFHLPTQFVVNALKNFASSGSKYLLATTHGHVMKNRDLSAGELARESGMRFLNLKLEPFNLGTPIESHTETVWIELEGATRELCLWEIN